MCQMDGDGIIAQVSNEPPVKKLNKLYFFEGLNCEYGCFVAAPTWKEARKHARNCEQLEGVDYLEVFGHACKQDGKYVFTEKSGQMLPQDLMAIGYTSFSWSETACEICGKVGNVHPVEGLLLCYDCEDSLSEVNGNG